MRKYKEHLSNFKENHVSFLESDLFDTLLRFERSNSSIIPLEIEDHNLAFDVRPKKLLRELAQIVANDYQMWFVYYSKLNSILYLCDDQNHVPPGYKLVKPINENG